MQENKLNFADFKKIKEIQSNKDFSSFIIEDPNTKNKYVQHNFNTNFQNKESKIIFQSNINYLIELSKCPGIFSIVFFFHSITFNNYY